MSEYAAGGPANIAGISYQLWYTVHKFIDALENPNLKVSPESKLIRNDDGQLELVAVDDLTIIDGASITHFNIKRIAPSYGRVWTVGDLVSKGVVRQFRDQLTSGKSKVTFVSESHCELGEIFGRLKEAETPDEIPHRLTQNQLKVWEQAVTAFGGSPGEVLAKSKQIEFEVEHEKDLEKRALIGLRRSFNDAEAVKNLLYLFAQESAKRQKRNIDKNILEAHLAHTGYTPYPYVSVQEALTQFNLASSVLRHAKVGFGLLNHHHLKRHETERLYNWIKGDLPQNVSPLALVTGTAGMGKTVVMRDLFRSCEQNAIPVLAIKADQLVTSGLDKLEQQLGISPGILPLVSKVLTEHSSQRVVVLVDQIDALSMSLGQNRKVIATYWQLITRILALAKTFPQIRVVISCRNYDLRTDPILKQLRPSFSQKVEPLEDPDVEEVLRQIGIDYATLSKNLKHLLATPLHLDIFTQIPFDPDFEIESLEGLYSRFWEQKVLQDQVGEPELLLQRISDEMLKGHSLIVHTTICTGLEQEKTFLNSVGILKENGRYISFFHQTFFDYTYARLFVQSGRSVKDLISHQHQGLFLRPRIKMLLQYLRSFDMDRYCTTISWMLQNDGLRFHLKTLAIDILVWQPKPAHSELKIWRDVICSSEKLKWAFIRALNSPAWVITLIKRKELHALINEIVPSNNTSKGENIAAMLVRCQDGIQPEILKFLGSFGTSTIEEKLTAQFLGNLNNWESPDSLHLIVKHQNYFAHRWPGMLAQIAPFHLQWTVTQYIQHFTSGYDDAVRNDTLLQLRSRFFDINAQGGFQELAYLRELAEKFPNEAFEVGRHVLLALSNPNYIPFRHKAHTGPKLYGGSPIIASDGYTFPAKDSHRLPDIILSTLLHAARTSPDVFRAHIKTILPTHHRTLYLLLVRAMTDSPDQYLIEIFDLFIVLNRHQVWFERSILNHAAIELAASAVPKFSDEYKDRFLNFVNGLSNPRYTRLRDKWQKCHFLKYNGLHKFRILKKFSDEDLRSFPPLYKRFGELRRKFENSNVWQENFSSGWKSAQSPVPVNRMSHMTLKTFIRFIKDPRSYQENLDEGRGGIIEIARAFQSTVEAQPEKFVSFVQELIRLEEKEDLIAYGISGLCKANFAPKILEQLILDARPIIKSRSNILTILYPTAYILSKGICSAALLAFVQSLIDHPDPEQDLADDSDGNHFGNGINSVRGAIAYEILSQLTHFPEYKNATMQMARQLAQDHTKAVKAALMRNLGVLTHLDREGTFEIFETLVQNREPSVLVQSAQLINYWTHHYWDKIEPYLQSMMPIESLQDHLGQILYYCHEANRPGATQLLQSGITLHPIILQGAVRAALSQAEKSATPPAFRQQAVQFILPYANHSINRDVRYLIENSFLHFEDEAMDLITPLTKIFIDTHDNNTRYGSLLEFWEKTAGPHPQKTLEMIQYFTGKVNTLQSHIHELRKLPQVILLSYHSLRDYAIPGDPAVELALDLIDWLGAHPIFSSETKKEIELAV